MGIHQINSSASYVQYLQKNPQEVDLLFRELLIGVTSFFRDPSEWELLRDKLFPALLAERPEGGVLRAWSAGCSSGEEAYSLAIIFKEALGRLKPTAKFSLQIFATDLDHDAIDLDHDAIDLARQGLYPFNIAAQVSNDRLQRFFNQEESGFRIKNEIREMVTFAPQNIIMDPPFIKLDLLICHNLLIYLESDLQKRLLQLFHYSLNPGGLLFWGSAETVGNLSSLFATPQPKSRPFRRQETTIKPENQVFPALMPTIPSAPSKEKTMPQQPANLQSLAEQLLLRDYSPPAVLTNDQGDILYISGGTVKGLKVGSNEKTQPLELSIQPIRAPEALQGMVLVVFREVPSAPALKTTGRIKAGSAASIRIAELEEELKQAREGLQTTREEMQGSQEELKSMNEELQSTNEELTTSKEEMQSMNEELQTVNAEQAAKMDELERLSNDMQNLLNSTEIITLFLDNELKIKRFTSGANKLFKLIAGDIGRPLTVLSSELNYPDVLQTLVYREKEVSASDGRWFTVRIMPYRTADNRIDGVVMIFTDITRAKQLEAELRLSGSMYQTLLQTLTTLILGLSTDGKILDFNPAAEKQLGCKRAEIVGRNFVEQFIPAAERIQVAADLQKILTAELQTLTTEITTADQRRISLRWTACPDLADDGKDAGLIGIGQNMPGDV